MTINISRLGILRGLGGTALLVSSIACVASEKQIPSCREGSVEQTAAVTRTRVGSASTQKGHSVKLSWTPPATPVAGYVIERRESDGEYSPLSLQLIRGTSCIDFDVVVGHVYFYRAKSVGNGGARSVSSGEARAAVNPH